MKKADNNEVDLLLRALASDRQKDRLPSADGQRGFSDHLDADELNAFAEGQLPQLARARYTKHLADCESCRGILVMLTPAAGVTVSQPVSESQTATSVWSRILVFLSPQVLRYAVPVLALAAVIGVSLFALRQQRTTDFVAQHQPESSSAPAGLQNAAPATPPNARPPLQEENVATQGAEVSKERSNVASPDQLAGNTAATDVTTGAATKGSAKIGEAETAQAMPSFAPEPQSPAPPPPRPALSEADKAVTLNRQDARERDAIQPRQEDYKTQRNDEAESNRSAAKTSSTSVDARRVEGLTAERRGFLLKNKKDGPAETETRGVAGRQFRRRGNAWVDTAYDSSRATINVARGSEQFRALVADEPRIADIANHLGGEVIVVWKGTAYRIR